MSNIREQLFEDASKRVEKARKRWGTHDSVEFTCCRISEESGELIQAATSRSKGRPDNRAEKMYDEAVDLVAMVFRLLEEWPNGRTKD